MTVSVCLLTWMLLSRAPQRTVVAGGGGGSAMEGERFYGGLQDVPTVLAFETATATAIVATTVTAPATARVLGEFPWKGE